MGGRVASCSLLLHLLLVMVVEASGTTIREESKESAAENSVISMVVDGERGVQMNEMAHDSQESSMAEQNHEMHAHTDRLAMIFFAIDDLKVGKKLAINFPKRNPPPPLLPKATADRIPFSLNHLPEILNFFSFSPGSPEATAVGETLRQCEMEPIIGETKLCVTSFESMVDFVGTAFGGESNFRRMATAHLTNSGVHFQNYTFIRAAEEIAAPKIVPCHAVSYPYATFYCHYQEGEHRVLRIALEGDNGDRVDAVAVCHMDTSGWSRSHPAFQLLKMEPGSAPVCHFFPADDAVWIPANA